MSKSKPFTHLHFHTQYSLLDGACKIGEVMDTARQSGMTAAAITDHGVMYGVIDFYKAARKAGIKPILGCEVYMAPDGTSRHDRKLGESNKQSNHLVLLAEDLEGYYNLSKLVSIGHLEGFYYKPRIDKEILAEHSKGLVCLSACLAGEVAGLCAKKEVDQALAKVGEYTDIFGKDNYYLELQDHGLPEQRIANRVNSRPPLLASDWRR